MQPILRSLAIILACAVALVACGGAGNPMAPSDGAQGVTLQGTVLGAGGAAGLSASSGGASAATVSVSVQESPAITTTVSAEGTFTLRGLPTGGFTLVFSADGSVLGTIAFSGVAPNQEITITVQISASSVSLVEQRRNGIGHGDVEIEGSVASVLVLDPASESRFVVSGYTVVARPGETAIREGNRARGVADVTVGRRVHVKGSWLPLEGQTQPVLALEIKLQGPGNGGDDDDDTRASFCPDAGRKAEVEGKIVAIGASELDVMQQGKGLFRAAVDAQTTIRKGNRSFLFTELQAGWRVHAKGTSLGLSADVCSVQASEIKVQ